MMCHYISIYIEKAQIGRVEVQELCPCMAYISESGPSDNVVQIAILPFLFSNIKGSLQLNPYLLYVI